MEGETPAEDVTPVPAAPANVGEKLRAARLAQGLELSEIAARTRIPQRHLVAIEEANYSGLPSPTYAMGFAKAYARAVGADEVALGRELRGELDRGYDRPTAVVPYEMTDPTRTPPRGLVLIVSAVGGLVLLAIAIIYGTGLLRGSAPPANDVLPGAEASPTAAASAAPTPAPIGTGAQVALVAIDKVWLRVSDGKKRLFEKEMAAGERYELPMDAQDPKVKTGRGDKVGLVVNGADFGPLGPADQTLEVSLTPDALRARQAAAAQPAPGSGQPLQNGAGPAF